MSIFSWYYVIVQIFRVLSYLALKICCRRKHKFSIIRVYQKGMQGKRSKKVYLHLYMTIY